MSGLYKNTTRGHLIHIKHEDDLKYEADLKYEDVLIHEDDLKYEVTSNWLTGSGKETYHTKPNQTKPTIPYQTKPNQTYHTKSKQTKPNLSN